MLLCQEKGFTFAILYKKGIVQEEKEEIKINYFYCLKSLFQRCKRCYLCIPLKKGDSSRVDFKMVVELNKKNL